MKEQLKGTIESFDSSYGFINADNGDWYNFSSKEKFKKGNRVVFEPVDSPEAMEIACIGGPIPCVNVRLLSIF